MGKDPKSGLRIALLIVTTALKMLWWASMVLVPLLGMWLSSSLAAYHNSSIGMSIAFGMLLFPALPLLWDRIYLWRRSRREQPRKQVLTGLDRLILRTLSLNLLFILLLLTIAPTRAFRAVSTRGDWALEGHKSTNANRVRGMLFDLASTLEGQWERGSAVYGNSDSPPPKKDTKSSTGATSTGTTEQPDPDPSKNASGEAEKPRKGTDFPVTPRLNPALAAMPEAAKSSYQSVGQYLAANIEDPVERTHALHDFVVLHLEYDDQTRDAIMAKNYANLPSQEAEAVFASQMAVCAGYAKLMVAMGKEAGLEIAYIVGNARILMRESEGVGHAWNAVKLNEAWYLIDATWDDSTPEGQPPATVPKTSYLFTPPEIFSVGHFPDEPSWQLRDTPLSLGEFMRQPDVRPEFSNLGLRMISPDRSQVTVSSALEIQIGNPQGAYLLASSTPKAETGDETECSVTRGDPSIIHCPLGGDGEYIVNVFASKSEFGKYPGVAQVLANKN